MYSEDRKYVFLAFMFSLLPALFLPVVWPHLRLTFFAPFLSLMCYKRPLLACLWLSIGCGLIVDLLGAHTRIGFFAVTYWITIAVLYRLKRQFFEDKLSTLPIMTFFFAVFSTIIQAILLNAIGITLNLTAQWIVTDLLLYPLADAMYALLWFAIPSYLLRRRPNSRDNTMSFR